MANRRISDEVRETYLAWLMMPPGEREPATKDAMAEELGVSRKTLYNWEESEEFQAELRQLRAKWGIRFQGEILARLMEIVQNGSDRDATSAARVLLRHIDVRSDEDAARDEKTKEEVRAALKEAGFQVLDD